MAAADETPKTKRPEDTDWRQQRLKAWTPVMTPLFYICTFASIGSFFLIVGGVLTAKAANAVVIREQYDGTGTRDRNKDCHIEVADVGRKCKVRLEVDDKMKAPVHVFYEIENFHQNHRRYMKSRSWDQLYNREMLHKDELGDCDPLIKNGSRVLNPCGVISNTLFNDIFTLKNSDIKMKEDDISWKSDVSELYKMPDHFEWENLGSSPSTADSCIDYATSRFPYPACEDATCASFGVAAPCYAYACVGGYHDSRDCDSGEFALFHYYNVAKYQYLYETFSQVISPIVGVNSEHYAVWARLAALPLFRKLYGRITEDLKKGDVLVFEVENNWDSHAFSGKKAIVISTATGFEVSFLGTAYLTVGTVCLVLAVLFGVIQIVKPRTMGDARYVPWLNEKHD